MQARGMVSRSQGACLPLRGFTGFGLFCRPPYRRTWSQCDDHGQGPSCPGSVMHTFCLLAKPKPHGRKDRKDEVGEIISLLFSTHLFNVCQGANLLLLHFTTKLIVSLIGLLRTNSWSWFVSVSRTGNKFFLTDSHCIAQTSLKLLT